MPIRRAQASQNSREVSPSRNSHSSSRPAGMGNRLVPTVPAGKSRQTPVNRFAKKNIVGRKHIGEGVFHNKSSGPMTTVGEMIPFQRASRREPHVEPQSYDRDGNGRMLQTKDVDEVSPKPINSPANDNRTPGSNQEKGPSTSSGAKQPLPGISNKTRPPNDKQPQARSVRPKLKRPLFHQEHPNTPASQHASSSNNSAKSASAGAIFRRTSGQEIVSVSSTSPRRRIVRQKSQTQGVEKNNSSEVQLPSSQQNERLQQLPQGSNEASSHGNEDVSRADMGSFADQVSPREIPHPPHVVRNSLDSARTFSRPSTQPLNQSLPETQIRTDSNVESNSITIGTTRNSVDLSNTNNSHIPAELRPRPLQSARVPLARSLSRNGESRNSVGSDRPTIHPSIASATELDGSRNITEIQDRHPNSVRRSLERTQSDNHGNNVGETPRLTRQSASNVTPRPRQREMIDVNTAVSVLSRRVPPSSETQSRSAGANQTAGTVTSRQDQNTPSTEDIWVPQRRLLGRNSSVTPDQSRTSLINSPRNRESSAVERVTTPDIIFRDSPVTDIPQRRYSRLPSTPDADNFPSVANTTRPAPTMPSRRGLYRALSVNDGIDNTANSSVMNRNTTTPSNHRENSFSRIENVDSDDIVSWRQIESEHSYPSREPRQRLIYQDRSRGRDSILHRNTLARRVVPPSLDSVPDITDDQEFPPLGSSRNASSSNTPIGLGSRTRHEQALLGSGQNYEFGARRSETPPPTPTPGRNPLEERSPGENDHMVEHLVLLASPIFGPLMLQASPAVLFNMLSRARRDFGGEFVELLIENVVLSLLAQHTFDVANQPQNNSGAPPPASQDTINSLDKVTVTKQMVSEEAFCAICHCEYAVDEVLDQLPCKHNFHNQCISVWLNKSGTCPVCRHKLYTETIE